NPAYRFSAHYYSAKMSGFATLVSLVRMKLCKQGAGICGNGMCIMPLKGVNLRRFVIWRL
ncbi:50S ribosomal protein L33 [Rhodobacterales bacterium HTCC2150]|nr:50S ribosomal protein L33 [Rhodobacterales bacterium HTCC2150] [Rhodobacteraceae bacterium HTCC2150]